MEIGATLCAEAWGWVMGIADSGPDSPEGQVGPVARTVPARDSLGTFVVGIDGSDTSGRALYYAFGLARRQRSHIVAVHAVAVLAVSDGMGVFIPPTGDALAEELNLAVQDLAHEHRVPARFVSVFGEPVGVIVRVARDERADGIVLGASKARGHRFFGSTAVRAVRCCPCPVTVVP